MRRLSVLVAIVAGIAVAWAGGWRPVEAASTPNIGGPVGGMVGTPIEFSGVNSINAVSWEWNFGDGTTATGIRVTKTYTEPGIYTVTLTTKDEFGVAATATTTATILWITGVPLVVPHCAPAIVNGVLECGGVPVLPLPDSHATT